VRFGTTVQFVGKRGEHNDPQGKTCPGRFFDVKQVGVGGAYTNYVECTTCHRELPATEGQLLHSPISITG